jgi:prepilin-type N-terminal cleavage/methylation domain-containing protein
MIRILRPNRRSGMTLIELLVVMGIIVVLASLAVLVTPGLSSRHVAAQAASNVSGWMLIAKQRALRDLAPRGIRLINNNGVCTQLEYIEQPEAFRPIQDNGAGAGQPAVLIANPPQNNMAILGGFSDVNAVQMNDILKITGTTAINSYRITAVAPTVVGGVNCLQLTVIPDIITNNQPLPPNFINYQIIRRKRTLVSETALQLPKSMRIHLGSWHSDLSTLGGPQPTDSSVTENFPTGDVDILFAPGGPVLDSVGGKIILWVESVDDTSEPTLIVIYARTGAIAAHPPGGDFNSTPAVKYRFAKDGRGSGL